MIAFLIINNEDSSLQLARELVDLPKIQMSVTATDDEYTLPRWSPDCRVRAAAAEVPRMRQCMLLAVKGNRSKDRHSPVAAGSKDPYLSTSYLGKICRDGGYLEVVNAPIVRARSD